MLLNTAQQFPCEIGKTGILSTLPTVTAELKLVMRLAFELHSAVSLKSYLRTKLSLFTALSRKLPVYYK